MYNYFKVWELILNIYFVVGQKLIFRLKNETKYSNLEGSAELHSFCIWWLYYSVLYGFLFLFVFLYEMNVSFVGGYHFMWCWNYSPALYFILGSDWCQKYCLYQDICTEWRLLGDIQCPDVLCWWCTGTIYISHSFLPWTLRCKSFWIYICKTFNYLRSYF